MSPPEAEPLGAGRRLRLLLTPTGGLSTACAGNGSIEVYAGGDAMLMGHIETPGNGSELSLIAGGRLSIGGIHKENPVGGYLSAGSLLELSSGTGADNLGLDIFPASTLTTSARDSRITMETSGDARILGTILAGGRVENIKTITEQVIGRRNILYTYTSSDGEPADSATEILLRSGGQVRIGRDLVAGARIEVEGGNGGSQGNKSVLVYGSAHVETLSPDSILLISGSGDIDLFGAPYSRIITGPGWLLQSGEEPAAAAVFTLAVLGEEGWLSREVVLPDELIANFSSVASLAAGQKHT